MTKKKSYPHKADDEKRIVVSLSLSGDELRYFREAFALTEGHEPGVAECREKARDLAYGAIDTYIKRHIEIEGAIIL